MPRDTEQELERLQSQLLQEAQEEAEEFSVEEDFAELLWEEDQGENPQVYQNYSNDYGRNLRNFATGYKAYNTDQTDADLDEYCDLVQQEPKITVWWVWIVLLLMGAVVGAIAWMFFSTGGWNG